MDLITALETTASGSPGPPNLPALPRLTELPLLLTAAGVVAVLMLAVVTWQVARARVAAWRHEQLTVHAQEVVITPPPVVEAAGAGMWWANLAGILRPSWRRRLIYGTPHIGIEYRWAARQLQIVVWVPGTVPARPVAGAVRAAWPGANARIQDATTPVPIPARVPARGPVRAPGRVPGRVARAAVTVSRDVQVREAGTALAPVLPGWYPMTATGHTGRTGGSGPAGRADPLRALIAAGSGLHSSEAACVQVLARPAAPGVIRAVRAGAGGLRTGTTPSTAAGGRLAPERVLSAVAAGLLDLLTPGPSRTSTGRASTAWMADPIRERDARPGIDKSVGPLWEVAVRLAVTSTQSRPDSTRTTSQVTDGVARRLRVHAYGLASALAVHDGRNRFRRLRLAHPAEVLAGRVMRSGFVASGDELAVLAGLPTDLAVAGLDRARAKAVPAPITVPAGGRGTKALGRAEAGGHAVALPVADARQHLHVLGSTGVGKSTLLAHLILQDVRARRAVVLIDPKGDLALDVLALLPDDALDRLILIDPDQPAGSAHFNPLQLKGRGDGADADVIVDHLVSIFASIFQRHWGPRIDDVLRVACLTLMRRSNPTLANVPPLLTSKQFRAPFTVGLDDPEGLLGFWQWYETTPPALRAQVIGPVLARLRSFLLRDFIKNTVGRASSSFDMGQVLNGGGILIARLPKGQLGDDASRMLASLLLASVWHAATARARQAEDKRRDAVVYIDEAHNVLNLAGSVADILAEARGYRLGMVLAHQDLAQFPRDTQLAISANARNKIFFNCSPEDARQLARHTLPELDEHDLSHLDAYTAAARLMIGNREAAAFTLTTNPPRPTGGPAGETGDLPGSTRPDGPRYDAGRHRRVRLDHVRDVVARIGPPPEPSPATTSSPAAERAEPADRPGADAASGRAGESRDSSTNTPSQAPTTPASTPGDPTSPSPQVGDTP